MLLCFHVFSSLSLFSSNTLSPEAKKKLEEERERNKALEAQMRNDYTQEQRVHKLLLLGAGESGKSTLFKQVRYSLTS
jgi:polynucleotide 5'-kinase involved in rRNA processing